MSVEDTAEDHPGQRHRRGERHPDDVHQVVVAEPGRLRVTGGVEEDRQPAPRQASHTGSRWSDRRDRSRRHRCPVRRRADPGPPPEPTSAAAACGVGEGKRAQTDEAIWMRGHQCGDALVLRRGQCGRQVGVEPVGVLHRRERDDLDIDAHGVHVGQPDLGRGELVAHRLVISPVVAQGLLRTRRGCAGRVRCEVRLGDRPRPGDGEVGVDVDCLRGRSLHGRLPVTVTHPRPGFALVVPRWNWARWIWPRWSWARWSWARWSWARWIWPRQVWHSHSTGLERTPIPSTSTSTTSPGDR